MAKRKTAGTAYLEALGVTLILMLLFACAMRFSRAAQSRLLEARSLRASAWSKALAGCESGTRHGVACNEPVPPEARTAERDVAAFIAGMLAKGAAR